MAKKLFEIAADIVQAQAAIGQMSPEDIASSLMKTFSVLQRMQKSEEEGVPIDQAKLEAGLPQASEPGQMSPQESVQNDKIVCLECGAEFRQLTAKHLDSHGLSPREYKRKYGFSMKTPLSAKELTRARSRAAKKRGLPESLLRFQEERRQRKMEAAAGEPASPEAPVESNVEAKPATKRGRKKQAA